MHRLPLTLATALVLAFGAHRTLLAQPIPPIPIPVIHMEDTDGNGVMDHFYIDRDGDGHWNECYIDMDGNLMPEERWIDDDDDGSWNTRQLNPDQDQDWDSGMTDRDEDGDFDWKWTDLDGDGAIDPLDEITPLPNGVPHDGGPTPQNPPTPGSACLTPGCVTPEELPGLGGYLPFEIYALNPTAPTLAAGYHSDLGRCGQLAGWIQTAGIANAVVTVDGVTTTLTGLPTPSYAFDVTSDYGAVGMYAGPSGFAPFFAAPGGPMLALPTLGGEFGQATAVNDAFTRIVGNSTAGPGFPPFQPTLWTVVDNVLATPYALPVLSTFGGSAYAVNLAGSVCGTVADASGSSHAAIWTGTPGAYELIDLGPGTANDINDHGVVVGSLDLTDGSTRGFVYEAGIITVLRSPIGLGTDTHRAQSVNERGEIVGSITLPNGDSVAAYWPHAEGFPIVLEDRVDGELALVYELTSADTINDAGQILAAGYQGAEPLTFRLDPIGADTSDANFDGIPDSCQGGNQPFQRGDLTGDGAFNIADPIAALAGIFGTGSYPTCEDAADFNDDGSLDISDPVFGLLRLFGGGQPLATGPGCLYDATPDPLTCEFTPTCSAASVVEDEGGIADTPCVGGALILVEAHFECIGGTWHQVTNEIYSCPDGTTQTVRISDVDTGSPCP